MAAYMRMQNQAVTSAKNAQVNAALNQVQHSRLASAQGQAFPRTTASAARQQYQPPRYQYPAPRYQPPAQQQVPQTQQPLYVAPPRNVVQQSQAPQQAPQQIQQRPAEQFVQRQVIQQRPVQRQVVQQSQSRGIGLQDRISKAIKKTFTRPQPTNVGVRNVAHQIPAHATHGSVRQVAAVEQPVEPGLPTLAEEPQTRRAQNLEYRPEPGKNDQVIIPSFVDAETDLPELKLTSTEEPIGSGLRQPAIASHPKPMSYRRRVAQRGQVSVFQNSSTQVGTQDADDDAEQIRRLREEIDARRQSSSDNELPQRPDDVEPSLLDLDDEDTEEAARRARSKLDAQLDAIEDVEDEIDLDEEDEDSPPPVFDERGCEELRGLLLDKSILDISLDLSPPASARRNEIGLLSRQWTDTSGNVLGSGTMVDIRRGYVILDSGLKLPYARLSDADLSAISENWLLPSFCSVGQRGSVQRNWAPQTVSWHATSLCHKPLYFENRQLERYGHSRGPFLQPIHSSYHFFRSLFFLPYNTAINPPNECQYSLGFYRPGNCAPWLLDTIPFSRAGIRRQALVSVGLAFIP